MIRNENPREIVDAFHCRMDAKKKKKRTRGEGGRGWFRDRRPWCHMSPPFFFHPPLFFISFIILARIK